MSNMKKAGPVDDLELYELIVAAYPDKFNEHSEDCIWDEVMNFAEEQFGGIENVSELLGRLVYLTMPQQTAITGRATHALGPIKKSETGYSMMAAVSRGA